jgi:hypothetical protein
MASPDPSASPTVDTEAPMKMLLALLAFVMTAALGSANAFAYTLFAANGSGCVPADVDIAADNYESVGPGVRFRGSSTGDIRLLCKVNRPLGHWENLRMSVKDPDGMDVTYRIRGALLYAPRGSNISTTVATCDSNTSDTTSHQTIVCDFFDLTPNRDNVYWFEITIERSSTAANPEFLGIQLQGT